MSRSKVELLEVLGRIEQEGTILSRKKRTVEEIFEGKALAVGNKRGKLSIISTVNDVCFKKGEHERRSKDALVSTEAVQQPCRSR